MAETRINRFKRKRRIRKKISGTADKPRLTIFRSLKHIYVQLIDDAAGKTLASAHSVKGGQKSGNQQAATMVGEALAQKAKSLNIKQVCFDRNGYIYHGTVKAFADAVRKEGINF